MEPPTVVIDNGTGYSKMGYAGNLDPSYIIPSTIATSLAKVSAETDGVLSSFVFRNRANWRTPSLTTISATRRWLTQRATNWAISWSQARSKTGKENWDSNKIFPFPWQNLLSYWTNFRDSNKIFSFPWQNLRPLYQRDFIRVSQPKGNSFGVSQIKEEEETPEERMLIAVTSLDKQLKKSRKKREHDRLVNEQGHACPDSDCCYCADHYDDRLMKEWKLTSRVLYIPNSNCIKG